MGTGTELRSVEDNRVLHPSEPGAAERSIPGGERRARVFDVDGERVRACVRAVQGEEGCVRAREQQSWLWGTETSHNKVCRRKRLVICRDCQVG